MNKHVRDRYPQGMYLDRITLGCISRRKLTREIKGETLYRKYY